MNRLTILPGFLCFLLLQSTARADHTDYKVVVTIKRLRCLAIPTAERANNRFYGYFYVDTYDTRTRKPDRKGRDIWKRGPTQAIRLPARTFVTLGVSRTITISSADFRSGARGLEVVGDLWAKDGTRGLTTFDAESSKMILNNRARAGRRSLTFTSKGGTVAELEYEVTFIPPRKPVKPLPYADVFGQWQMGKIRLSFTKSGRWFMSNPEDANNNYAGPFKYVSKSGNIIKLDLVVSSGSSAGHTLKAIFRRDGNNLEYCGSYKARPTQFKQGGGSVYWIFRQR